MSLQDIEKLDFEKEFSPIIPINHEEFYDAPGKQHYRLLSYFTTTINNSIIIDIGTHRGSSALALSYNPTNTIYSFDIVNNVVNTQIQNRSNISFSYDNLFDENIAKKYTDLILESAFIFLDVDPHNGEMEWGFYNYLKSIGYNKFVICDDIYYFKEMRNEFWYKVLPLSPCYDYTEVGHWSGTGIISYGTTFTKKYDVSNWTMVTAYFDLTNCPDASEEIRKRDNDYYFSYSFGTLKLPYNMVIYCDNASLEKIQNIRPPKYQTKYIVLEFDDFEINGLRFSELRNKIITNRQKNPYYFDNRNTASYYLFCISRYIMLREVIKQNYFQSTHFAWINFCIERMGFRNLIRLEEGLAQNRDKFSTCYIDFIPESLVRNTPEYFKWGRCGMCSGYFTGNREYMDTTCELIINKFIEYVDAGYGHADEQLYSAVYFDRPELFQHYYGDYTEMVTNYTCVYDRPEPIVNNFIRNSFKHKYYDLCQNGCQFLLQSLRQKKCTLSHDFIKELAYYTFATHPENRYLL
jgi:hypothetical protein